MTVFAPTAARLAALLAAVSFAGEAAAAGDAASGQRIAARWCASCHAVGREEPRVSTEAKPFVQIARTPEFNDRSLALFLLDPHPKMPDMGLSRAEAADLAAYILSLRNY